MAGDLLTRLEAKLEDAQREEEAGKQQRQVDDFIQQYQRERDRKSSDTWGANENTPKISYTQNSKTTEQGLWFRDGSEVAERLIRGEISKIEIASPTQRAKLAASVYRSLDRAFGNSPRDGPSARRDFAKEAIAGIYLLQQLNDPIIGQLINEFYEKIEQGVNQNLDGRRDYDVALGIFDAMQKLGMADEYHQDLTSSPKNLLSLIQTKLRPQKPGTVEEEFQSGYAQVYTSKRVWGEGVDAPQAIYTEIYPEKGARRTKRINSERDAALLVQWLSSGDISDITLPPREQGKLYASLKKSIEWISQRGGYSSSVPQIIAGLSLLQRLNHPETAQLLSGLLEKRPEYSITIKQALESYLPKKE